MKKAEVIVFRGVQALYTYLVPSDKYEIGDHVTVPFGKNTCIGLILKFTQPNKRTFFKIKAIHDLEKNYPKVPHDLLHLIEWFKDYYHTTPYKAYQTIVGTKKFREVIPISEGAEIKDSPPPLTPEQELAVKNILNSDGYSPYLLHGITASGKTEVYMQVAQHMMNQKKQTLLCLPEIALTPQFTDIFKKRFGNTLMVVHSGLTPKQKEVAWNHINEGHISVVIGPRSAIFSPLRQLGAIIIDEEHETTYKQDQHPRYYTHHVAEFRAKAHHATLILGSATPAIDTFDVFKKSQQVLPLTQRIYNRPLPTVTIIDMKEQISLFQEFFISKPLQDAIEKSLKNKQKVLILVNRRGFSTHIMCQSCGSTHECPNCKLSLTYHKDKTLRCHRCDTKQPLTHTCKKCKKNTLQYGGTGIQKIEMELKRRFSQAHIIRLDRDEAKTAKAIHEKLSEFKEQGDILIGTQMIAKGHHIESVTTVGVIGIDSTLNIPDFRSPERTFQLITQVAGRAGRGKEVGQVIVQTTQPEHYAIQYASEHNYNDFYRQEVSFREQLWYPPYSSLINILFSAENPKIVEKYVQKAFNELSFQLKSFNEKIQFIGPKPAPIERINTYYRWNLLIKCQTESLAKIKKELLFLNSHPKNVRVIVDFDPRSIL